MTTEGSIKRPVWEGIFKENHKDVRLKYVEQRMEVVKHHQLQVSTLEGIYHDLMDLLEDDAAKINVVRLMTEVTATQASNVGLGLRQTFFEVGDALLADDDGIYSEDQGDGMRRAESQVAKGLVRQRGEDRRLREGLSE